MNEHTPGPWHTDQTEGSTEVHTGDGICVAQAIDPYVYGLPRLPEAEVLANARLIAAAPELLTALQEATDALAMQLNFHRAPGQPWEADDQEAAERIERFRSVIEKAEGRAS